MDILLIDPPHAILKGGSTDRGYNVGLTSLAAYISNEGIDTAVLTGDTLVDLPSNNTLAHRIASVVPDWLRVSVKELAEGQRKLEATVNDKNHVIWDKLTGIVKQTEPIAVGISYLTPLKCVVERIAGLIREVDRDIKIVVGSFHPTFCPEDVMQNPDIDFIIRGEGEIPLLHLVKEIKKDSPKWETVPGIYYRDGDGQVRHNPGVNTLNNLDELPFLARNLVLNCDYNVYRVHAISTARGCPYTCSFCADRRFWGEKVRRRSVESVIEELRLLKDKYTVDAVDFVDGTFTYDRKYLQILCNKIIDYRLNIKWRCTARYDNLDEELLQLMKQANCSALYLGLESGSNRVLEDIDKRLTVEKITEASKIIYDSGIPSITSVLLGLPDEGKEDIKDTLELMREFKTDFFDVNSYVPLAGTQLYDSMSEEDKKSIDWRKVGYKSWDNNFSKNISHDEFNRYQSEAYEIANNLRKRSLVRLGVRMLFRFIANVFKKRQK